jgi:hypothetical protein
MSVAPTIDFSDIDFEFRPVILPVPTKELDEDDPFTAYHDVASYCLDYTMHGDCYSVFCHVEDDGFTYFIANEDYDQSDGPFGEKLVKVEQPFSMAELVEYLEAVEEGSPSIGLHIYDSLDIYDKLPVQDWSDVEVGSELYPQLESFFATLSHYLIDWVNTHEHLPPQDAFLEEEERILEEIV